MSKVVSEGLTFDDVLIVPKFSSVESRKHVDIKVNISRFGNFLPIVSANMDSVTGVNMANALNKVEAIGCLHRFWDIESNVTAFKSARGVSAVSVGLGPYESARAKALYEVGASFFFLDVAHGAQQAVVDRYTELKKMKNAFVIVGNFASVSSVEKFTKSVPSGLLVDGFKIGIGPGAACTTRIQTGVGYPQLSAILEISSYLDSLNGDSKPFLVADGGCRYPGDVAKALGAGANMVMLGSMLAATDETPGEIVRKVSSEGVAIFKEFRGSASSRSYESQRRDTSYIAPEGETLILPAKGPVANVIAEIAGGVRSAFSYVGARNIDEFHKNVEFIKISSATQVENGAHGKNL